MNTFIRSLLISLIIVFVTACGGGGGGTTLTTITSFETSATTIDEGGSVNLTAVFENGTASINNGVGVVSSNVAKSVTPTSTTTYILKVTNSIGASITSSLTVTVRPAFNIFPPGFFGGSYSNDTVTFSGSDTDGATHNVTLLEVSGTVTSYNSQDVKTIDETLRIENVTGGGGFVGELSQQYWTDDLDNLKYIGYEVPTDSSYAFATSTVVMPLKAYIGDSGTMGSYERNDGSTFTITWQLAADTEPNAKYITTTVSKDSGGTLSYTATVTSIINKAGTLLSQEIKIIYHSDDDRTLTVTSS